MTIGQQLRAAREEQGMSIGDVARRTCIQPKFLHAIDEDNFGALPESHRRLFLREYAKAVALDPNAILSQLPDYIPPAAPAPAPPGTTSFGGDMPSGRGALSISTSSEAPSEHDRREYREILQRLSDGSGFSFARSNTALWLIVVACLLMVAGGLYYFIFRTEEPETADAPEGEVVDSTAMTTPIDGATPAGDTAAAAELAALGDSLTLEGIASGKVWFNVVMDGKRSETGTIDSGTTKVWRAAETFRVSLGNAGGLTLTLNERPLGTLGQRKTIVKNQVIDATGIVKKGTTRRSSTSARRSSPAVRTITPTELRTTSNGGGGGN